MFLNILDVECNSCMERRISLKAIVKRLKKYHPATTGIGRMGQDSWLRGRYQPSHVEVRRNSRERKIGATQSRILEIGSVVPDLTRTRLESLAGLANLCSSRAMTKATRDMRERDLARMPIYKLANIADAT